MPDLVYFAYGSNMLTARLAARCRIIATLGVATLADHSVAFAKRSVDNSGKATLAPATGRTAYGVAFQMAASELKILDDIEGPGYRRIEVSVDVSGRPRGDRASTSLTATTYVAGTHEDGLLPYDWYRNLILAGSEEHGLPPGHIAALRQLQTQADPVPDRRTGWEARELLAAHVSKQSKPATTPL